MQLTCIAIDDEPLALSLLQEYIGRFEALRLVKVFDDALEAVEFLRQHPVDLLFTDINMPDVLGTELVRSLERRPMVIFTTAHKQYALDGFELDALDYLLKPVSFGRFERAVAKALEYHRFRLSTPVEGSNVIFVRSEYQLVKIDLDAVEYIESVEDYLKIHRTGDKPVMTLMTLKAMMGKLPTGRFVRIHRSYIVPLAKIRSVVNRKVKLSSVELPVSESYLPAVQEWMRK